jgi:hypothetical protein
VGGVNLLKALAGPFPDVAFCPTGGITPETAPQFLKLPNEGLRRLADDARTRWTGDWARITQLAREASAAAAEVARRRSHRRHVDIRRAADGAAQPRPDPAPYPGSGLRAGRHSFTVDRR